MPFSRKFQQQSSYPEGSDHLLVYDGTDQLLGNLARGSRVPAVGIDAGFDPIQRVSLLLAGSRVKKLHILAHGCPGAIRFADRLIDQRAITSSASLLSGWGVEEIYIWSCSVGQDAEFTRTLSILTNAEVFSSKTLIGNASGANQFEVEAFSDRAKIASFEHFIAPEILHANSFSLIDISAYFKEGYLGTQGTNTNQAKVIKNFSTLGIDRIAFVQEDTDNDGLFDEVATQGNDVAGTLKIFLTDGTVLSLTGALNWRETTGSTIEVLGFIFGTGQTATINYTEGGVAKTFTITGGSTRDVSSTLGAKAYGSSFTFTDGENRSGNAATAGLLDALNSQLTSTPQPSSMSLTSASVVEGSNLVYTVTMSAATTQIQYFGIGTSGTATSGSDYSSDFSTYTYSNGVTYAGNGTLSVPSGVSSFTITIPTTDDAAAESTETLVLQVGNKAAQGEIIDSDTPSLSYSATTFVESTANNGSISTSITITLTNDTFTGTNGDNFVAGSKVSVTNVPSGLTAVVTKASATTVTLTLTGSASAHANANDISNLTVTFANTAFTGGNASSVTNYTKNNLSVNFADPPVLGYSGSTFSESLANDGSISTTLSITLTGDTFVAGVVSGSLVSASNVPAGLTASFTRVSNTEVSVTLTGTATAHANADDISNLTVVFADGAFTNTTTAANVTNYTKSNLVVNYADPAAASLSYSASTLVEGAANDGSISTTLTITLSNDTFTGSNGDDLIAGSKVSVANVPAGLTAVVTKTSATTATLTLTGSASAHANTNDISNLTVTFANTAFTGGNAAGVTNYAKNDLSVNFADPPVLTYSGSTFSESNGNDGSISTTLTITLTGDTFAAGVVSGSLVSASNVPAGLTASFTRVSDTAVSVTLTGTASSHANANDVSNLTITFADGAFTNTATAANVTNYQKSNLVVDYADPAVVADPPALSYSGLIFSESVSNDGSISSTISISLTGDTFASSVVSGGFVIASNVPAGLSASFNRVSATEISVTLTGAASAHANVNDISDLSITFQDGAFTNTASASGVTNYSRSDLSVDFANPAPSLSYSTGLLSEDPANDGSVGTVLIITISGDIFSSGVVSGNLVSAQNVPPGLTAVFTRLSDTQVSVKLTGKASDHANVNDISNLKVVFSDGAFVSTARASDVANSVKSGLVVDFDDPTFSADLNPESDTGTQDGITKVIDPEFNIKGGNLLTLNGSVRILDPNGNVLGSKITDAADLASGLAKVPVGVLDDGVYTFISQILDSAGRVIAQAPVSVTIVTDRDGIAPSIELAANDGDFNKDGIKDWEQNNVAQLPLFSVEAFNQGKGAPQESFGAIIAGTITRQTLGESVQLNGNAQLTNMSVLPLPNIALPEELDAVTPLFQFSVTAQDTLQLVDADPARPGLQTQVVIELPAGVNATSYVKYNSKTGEWVDFTNIAALNGGGDGAVLVDSDRDGRVDRVVLTLTDGGPGDEDGIVNGVIVDPGALAVTDDQALYATTSKKGDLILSKTPSQDMVGISFYTAPAPEEGLVRLKAYYNSLTGDYFYAPEGTPPPYACYTELKNVDLGYVTRPGQGAFDLHLYLHGNGLTQIVSESYARENDLLGKGYRDLGAIFGSTEDINIITLIGTQGTGP